MRDRREVLKLLAGGSAAAAGTSLIITTTAFADGGSTNCRPTGYTAPSVPSGSATVNASGPNFRSIGLTVNGGSGISIPSHTCPSCHGVTPTAARQYRWTLESSPATGTYALYAASGDSTAVSGFTTASSSPGQVFIKRTDGGPNEAPPTNGSFTIRLTIRWACKSVSGQRTWYAWTCTSYTIPVTYASISSATVGTIAQDTPGSACNSPSPTF